MRSKYFEMNSVGQLQVEPQWTGRVVEFMYFGKEINDGSTGCSDNEVGVSEGRAEEETYMLLIAGGVGGNGRGGFEAH